MTVATFPAYEYKYKKRLSDLIRRILHIQPGQQLYSLDDNIKFIQPRSLGVPIWWTNNGAIPISPLLAYRAINTPGSVWGAGPTTEAESRVNLPNPGGANDLIDGPAGIPSWNQLIGWTTNGAGQGYDTQLLIPDGSDYSVFVCYNYTAAQGTGSTRSPYGIRAVVGARFFTIANALGNLFASGGLTGYFAPETKGPVVVGTAARNCYRGGALITTVGDWTAPGQDTLMVGAGRNAVGVPVGGIIGNVTSFWLSNYDASAYVPDLHTIMLAL